MNDQLPIEPSPITITAKEGWNLYERRPVRQGPKDDENKIELPPGVTDYGNYNKMPEPYREVDLREYLRSGRTWVVQYTENRQITSTRNPELGLGTFLPVTIEWSWWGAAAVAWVSDMRFFMIGCEHDYEEYRREGMHVHHTYCTKCGLRWNYDSSG